MIVTLRIFDGNWGSSRKASARLGSVPIAIIDTSPGNWRTIRRMSCCADSATGFVFGSGNSTPASPLLPWTEAAVTSRLLSGLLAPADFQYPQSVGQSEIERHVAGDGSDRLDFHLGRFEREKDRQRVIDAGVGVDNDPAWADGRACPWHHCCG